jgi:hypothetical protein
MANKSKKPILKNIEKINEEEFVEKLDGFTKDRIKIMKNDTFKNNVLDIENGFIVSSIYLKKKSKLGRNIETMVWQYYRHRGKLDVNEVIKQYGRDNLIINYSKSNTKVGIVKDGENIETKKGIIENNLE